MFSFKNKSTKILVFAIGVFILLSSVGLVLLFSSDNLGVTTQETRFGNDYGTLEKLEQSTNSINLSVDWEETSTNEFNPYQYYLVDYPNSYPVAYLLPKFMDSTSKINNSVKYTNHNEKITFELPPTLINVDKMIVKKFVNSLKTQEGVNFSGKDFRITNIIDRQDYVIIEIAEIIKVPNQGEHDNLPTLKYGIYYLGVKNSSDGTIEFAKNKTEEFLNKLNNLKVESEDTELKKDFILNN